MIIFPDSIPDFKVDRVLLNSPEFLEFRGSDRFTFQVVRSFSVLPLPPKSPKPPITDPVQRPLRALFWNIGAISIENTNVRTIATGG